MLLASGMKISAEPKPENPRAVPDTNATAQIAIATLRLISAGRRLAKLMRYFLGMMLSESRSHLSASCPRHARNVPPVFLVTSATIFAPTASIS